MVFNTDIDDPLERIKEFWENFIEDTGYYDAPVMAVMQPHTATVHSPTQCTATFLLKVPLNLCNRMHNMHGGAASTVFDMATSTAVGPLARAGPAPFWRWAGVSRALSCTYLRPVPEGMTVLVVCSVQGITRRTASLRGEMWEYDEQTGKAKGPMLVVCEHDKVALELKGMDPAATKL